MTDIRFLCCILFKIKKKLIDTFVTFTSNQQTNLMID